MQLAFAIVQQPRMSALAKPLWPRPRTLAETARTRRWIRKATDSGYHPCGTVPMGADDDPHAATTGRGRVRGIACLMEAGTTPLLPAMAVNAARTLGLEATVHSGEPRHGRRWYLDLVQWLEQPRWLDVVTVRGTFRIRLDLDQAPITSREIWMLSRCP